MITKAEWEKRVEAYKGSGMSIRAWCITHGIPQSTFRFHLKKSSRSKFIELKPSFKGVKIHWKHLSFEIDPDFDQETLSRFLHALR